MSQKLLPRYVGPYQVLAQVGDVSYKLDLPDELSTVHDVFHVSLLVPYRVDADRSMDIHPPPEVVNGDMEYEVEATLLSRKARGGRSKEYLVKWKETCILDLRENSAPAEVIRKADLPIWDEISMLKQAEEDLRSTKAKHENFQKQAQACEIELQKLHRQQEIRMQECVNKLQG
ncbi:uncharacterized protein LOC112343782 [Selaginella moellendorffii]|uniref:uncharacterized protein LOC112343782 n=1 Tax=Selaginella moellendorffii TaxID=88036 RepID=UPI000D1CE9E7|nr:uncharacterized protein LOC112343782 [Selaginella moellendorffii]|eukprot:XP_024523583.1 uncharacterized protein LOC112343782 [Selaginella moellendorffii]